MFAQDSPGAAWKDVTEPDILPGRTLPQIATGNGGYAESVAADAAGLSVAPDKIGQVTAAWLDQVAANPSNTAVLADAGNLTDLKDEVFWRSGEGGATFDAADTHSVPADPVFALKTTSRRRAAVLHRRRAPGADPARRGHHQRPQHPRLLLAILISGTDLGRSRLHRAVRHLRASRRSQRPADRRRHRQHRLTGLGTRPPTR